MNRITSILCLLITFCIHDSYACSYKELELQTKRLLTTNLVNFQDGNSYLELNMNTNIMTYEECSKFTLKALANNRFLLNFIADGTPKKLQGKWGKIVSIPVLKHSSKKNHQIHENDIEKIHVKDYGIRDDTVLDEEELIGKKLKHNLSSHRPIHEGDILKTILIKKGSMVNVVYERGNLRIKTIAIAKESGELGNIIKVQNPKSKKKFLLVVQGANVGYVDSSVIK